MKTDASTESIAAEWQKKGAVKIPQLLGPAELSACREFYDWIWQTPVLSQRNSLKEKQTPSLMMLARRLAITRALNLYLTPVPHTRDSPIALRSGQPKYLVSGLRGFSQTRGRGTTHAIPSGCLFCTFPGQASGPVLDTL